MFINYNDFELIYLIKDNNFKAKQLFYDKYKYLIYKFYCNNYYEKNLAYCDFEQDCLLQLEKAIYKYNSAVGVSFYCYFRLIIKRYIIKLTTRNKNSFFEEISRPLKDNNEVKKNSLLYILNKELENDFLAKEYIDFCLLGGRKNIDFQKKYDLSYYEVKKIDKKIKLMVQKILTI